MIKSLKRIFQSKKQRELDLPNVHGLSLINVIKMPAELNFKISELNCKLGNHCYANSLKIVNHYSLAEKYVLCFVEKDGIKYPHAIIKLNGKYYDPSLNHKLNKIGNYWLHTEFSKNELREFVKQWYGDEFEKIEIYPPALLKNGKIACVHVPL